MVGNSYSWFINILTIKIYPKKIHNQLLQYNKFEFNWKRINVFYFWTKIVMKDMSKDSSHISSFLNLSSLFCGRKQFVVCINEKEGITRQKKKKINCKMVATIYKRLIHSVLFFFLHSPFTKLVEKVNFVLLFVVLCIMQLKSVHSPNLRINFCPNTL